MLGPLLRLRQACSHPQAVRGQFLTAAKATMSMEELLESLIKKTQCESEEALRQYIAALNGTCMIFFSFDPKCAYIVLKAEFLELDIFLKNQYVNACSRAGWYSYYQGKLGPGCGNVPRCA